MEGKTAILVCSLPVAGTVAYESNERAAETSGFFDIACLPCCAVNSAEVEYCKNTDEKIYARPHLKTV